MTITEVLTLEENLENARGRQYSRYEYCSFSAITSLYYFHNNINLDSPPSLVGGSHYLLVSR